MCRFYKAAYLSVCSRFLALYLYQSWSIATDLVWPTWLRKIDWSNIFFPRIEIFTQKHLFVQTSFFPNICLSKLKTSFSPHLCLSKPKLWSKLKRVLFIFVSDPPNSKVAYAPDNPNAVIWNIYSGRWSVLNLQKFLIFFIIQFSVIQDDK